MISKIEGMTKLQKRAWWKQKSERIVQRRFGDLRPSLASRRSSFVLEPDDMKRAGLMSQPYFFIFQTDTAFPNQNAHHPKYGQHHD